MNYPKCIERDLKEGIPTGEDITQLFFKTCNELHLGDLAACDSFSLISAMSAIELMDPKMDSGMWPIEDTDIILQKSGMLSLVEMEPEQLIATIDGTLAMLVCWLQAQPLDQTFYTNVCLVNVGKLKDPILDAFSFAAMNLLIDVRTAIEVAGVFNEEDFTPISCHISLEKQHIKNYSQGIDKLEMVLKDIHSKLQAKSSSNKHLEAIEARMMLLVGLFDLFQNLLPPHLLDATSNKVFVPNFKKSALAVDRCLALLKMCIKTLSLGTNPTEGSGDFDFSWLPAFQPQINRQFSPPNFPREPKFTSRVDSFVYFQSLLTSIKRMISDIPNKMRSLEGILQLFRDFGGEDTCILSRSILQLIIMPNDYTTPNGQLLVCGQYPLNEIVKESISQFDIFLTADGLLLPSTNGDAKKDNGSLPPDEFIDFCSRAFIGVFQMYGHNLARQRDKLLRNCFEDFSVLSIEAEKMEMEVCSNINGLDSFQQTKPPTFSTFLLFHILSLMHYHFELGFRLDLFVPYEFGSCYWYFGEVVAKSIVNILERKCNLMILNYSRSTAAMAIDKKKSAKKQLLKQKTEIELRSTIAKMQKIILMHRVETTLSSAFVKFCIGLKASNRLAFPKGEWARYHRRTSEYSSLPSMLYVPYEEYKNFAEQYSSVGAQQCFEDAANSFEQAINYLKNFESLSEGIPYKVQMLLKIAKQNGVVAKLLSSPKLSNKKVLFDFAQANSMMFPTVKFL